MDVGEIGVAVGSTGEVGDSVTGSTLTLTLTSDVGVEGIVVVRCIVSASISGRLSVIRDVEAMQKGGGSAGGRAVGLIVIDEF